MKISCDKCNALYDVDDSRIPPQGLTMKCPRCQASFSVKRAGSAAPPPPGGGAARYYLRRRTGKVFGPFLERAIASMLEQHKLEGDEDISADGQSWSPLSSVPSLAGFVRGAAPARPAPAAGQGFGGADLADLPAPKGGLADLADLPAPKGGLADLADLPAPKGPPGFAGLADLPAPKAPAGLAGLTDLPAPKGARPASPPPPPSGRGMGMDGFDQSAGGGDPGEFDFGAPEEPAARGGGQRGSLADLADLPAPKGTRSELADLPAPKAPAGLAGLADLPAPKRPPSPPATPRSTGLDYGTIDLGADVDGELSDLPAPKDVPELPAPKLSPDLPAPKRAPTAPPVPPQEITDLPRPKRGGGLEYGQIELGGEEVAELDEIPVQPAQAGRGLSLDLGANFNLPAPKAAPPARETPDLVAPKGPSSRGGEVIDVVAPKRPAEPATEQDEEVVTFAPPPREAMRAAGIDAALVAPTLPPEEEELPGEAPRPRRIKPLWIAIGAGVFVLVLGILLGALTDLGFFGINLISGDYNKRQRAKARITTSQAALRTDTFRGYTQAADELELAAKAMVDQAEPWALQAQAVAALIYRYGPNPTKASQADSALAMLAKLEDQSPDAEKARAMVRLSAGDATAAAAALKKIADQDPKDASAAVYLGWAQLAARDYKAAIDTFARALKIAQDLPAAHFGTVQAACALSDPKACAEATETAQRAAPNHPGVLLRKARLLTAAGKGAEAQQLLQSILGLSAGPPEISTAKTLLAEQALLRGQSNEARRLLVDAVKIDERNAPAHFLMGKLYFNARQYSEAERLFRTARTLDPLDIPSAAMLVHAEIAMSRPLEAKKIVDEVLKIAPEAPEVIYLRGVVDEALEQLDTATKFFSVVIAKDPKHFDAYFHQAKIHLRQNRPDEALSVLGRAEEKIGVTSQIRAAQGEVLLLGKKPEKARQKLEEAVRLDGNNNLAMFLLASVLAEQGNPEQARDRLLALKARDQAFPGLAAKLGDVYLQLKLPSKAAAEYDIALAEPAVPPLVRQGAARAYLEAAKPIKALEQAGKLLDGDPTLAASARALMAEARFQQGKLDDALVEIQQALDREHKAAYFILLGRIQEARRKGPDALEAYTDALKIDGSNLEIRLRRAVLLVKGGTVKDGLKELKQVIASNPASAEAHFYMGEAHADLGQEKEALQSYLTAVSKDPKHGHAHLKIAQTYLDGQRYPQAQPHLEAAIRAAQPSDSWLPDAYYLQGNAAIARNQRKQAIEAFQQYLKVAPPTASLRAEAQKKLRALGAPVGSSED